MTNTVKRMLHQGEVRRASLKYESSTTPLFWCVRKEKVAKVRALASLLLSACFRTAQGIFVKFDVGKFKKNVAVLDNVCAIIMKTLDGLEIVFALKIF
jgi:hypothetical protein